MLAENSDRLSPERRKAARYLADHPDELAVLPLRELARNAGVKTTTLVRVANAIGYASFSTLREPFRASLRLSSGYVSDRARALERQGDEEGQLFAGMADATIRNLEGLFSSELAARLAAVAGDILAARRVVIAAVGSCYPLAAYFHYVARMALPKVVLSPQPGGLPLDDLMDLDERDLVLVLSLKPYRRETADAVRLAKRRGAHIIAITDSRSAPIAVPARTVLVVPTETPHFFPSIAALVALLETLIALLVKQGGRKAVGAIERFDQTRHEFSIWSTD